jgi:hypothetical protein
MSALAVMPETLLVGGRFAGPPGNGNGGYSCGRFARLVDGPAEVTLRGPVPLERRLDVRPGGDGTIEVADGEALVAVVCSIEPLGEIDPPVRPAPAEALEFAKRSPFLGPSHPFPGCFVCGPDHDDGLRQHPGPVEGAPVPAREPSVVVGWELGSEGRKLHSASALLSAEGEVLARARALWIALRPEHARS